MDRITQTERTYSIQENGPGQDSEVEMSTACAVVSARTDLEGEIEGVGKKALDEWAGVLPECQDALRQGMWSQRQL